LGWEYMLKPQGKEGYNAAALREMDAYVRRLPAVYQRSDGCYVLCDTEEIRDTIVSQNWIDQPRDGYEHIWIKPDQVIFGVDRNNERIVLIAEFIKWSISRWPANLYDQYDRPRTVAEFLEEANKYWP
jgi:hypothetical protein